MLVLVEEPRVKSCSCRWWPAPSLLRFPKCTMQGDFKAFATALCSGIRGQKGASDGIFSLLETQGSDHL